jgi:hypothetical protein
MDAGGEAMGLPAGEQLVLDTIDYELRNADPQLASAFAAFTSVTRKAGLPATEQLGSRHSPSAIPGCGRPEKAGLPFVLRLALLFVIGALLAVAMVAAFSAVRQARCTVPAWSRAATAKSWGAQSAGPTTHGCGTSSPKKTQPSRP